MVAHILLTPNRLKRKISLDHDVISNIDSSRQTIANIINHRDKRLLVIVGPCSIHDHKSALDYALRLKNLAAEVQSSLFLVMRVYLEKPRTTQGWQGLIKDPNLDNSFDVNKGLTIARELLYEINSLGLPTATEFLEPLLTPYIADLISWGAIGARTSESQIHRNLASGMNMAIGFKNSTTGDIQTAINALIASKNENYYFGIDHDGQANLIHTTGNDNTHLVLRGSHSGANYYANNIIEHVNQLAQQNLPQRIMIDCSHGNSCGNYANQILVLKNIASQLKMSHGSSIIGVMLESFIEQGKQVISNNAFSLEYGKSITDGCLGWLETEKAIQELAGQVKATRFKGTLTNNDSQLVTV